MALIDTIEAALLRLLEPIFKPLRPLVQLFTKLRDSTVGIFDAASTLLHDIGDEYDKIKHFDARPEWKNRVISVPAVFQHIQDLAQVPSQVIAAFKDLVNTLKTKIDPAAFNVDELEGLDDLRGLFKRFGSKLAAGFEKVLGVVALLADALVAIRSTIDDLQTIVDAVRTIRENLEHLDGLFLPQKNPRKLLRTQDGETFKIRVGSLHPS